MGVSFYIMSKERKGYATLFVRLQNTRQKINYRFATPLKVDIKAWNSSRTSVTQLMKFRDANPDLFFKLDEIRQALQATESRKTPCGREEASRIVNYIVNREMMDAARVATKPRVTLNKFIDQYLEQISTGARNTVKGTPFAPGTIHATKTALKQFSAFQKARKHSYDFDDINMQFYYDYTAYLSRRNYSINSIGKIIKHLKSVMAVAEAEGYHHNTVYKNGKFKEPRIEVDTIYLTKNELDAMMKADLSGLEPAAIQARDLFMVGVWTAQRVSDYNSIKKTDIQKVMKHWIEEQDDPDHPGRSRSTIRTKEITYLNIRQRKTGIKVAIPCREELRAILEKYDYDLPHMDGVTINRLIKQVARVAGITQPVTIEISKGGTKKEVVKEKCQLVTSHTARRTGATLMYLAGLDLYDIMKITGHASPEMLKKYIKADQLDVVQKLTDKYHYFD